ncbi:MAG: hypothetical protein WC341_09115 [Bacteroidales bacterium]
MQKIGFIQSRKGKEFSKEEVRLIVSCTIEKLLDEERWYEIAVGLSACNPIDKFDFKVGEKKALRRAIANWRKHSHVSKLLAATAWDHLFDAQRIKPMADFEKAAKRQEKSIDKKVKSATHKLEKAQ